MPTVDQAGLQSRREGLRGKHGAVGASVAVLSGDEITAAASGTANLRSGLAVATDTLFQIGSITKGYTATVVVQLVDEGLLDLDAPVVSYLPEFRVADDDATRTVTTRQLLSHT